MDSKTRYTALVVLVFLLVAGLRFIHLSADPPADLSTSAGPYGDPGGYAYNARNKVLFDRWVLDDFNPMYHTLIPHSVTYAVFRILGVGIAQMNLVPILFSLFGLFVFFKIATVLCGDHFGLLATALLGLNFLYLMYSRVGNRIMPMIFFLLLAVWFLHKGTERNAWFIPAGMSCVLAFITKGVCFYIVAAFVLSFGAYHLSRGFRKETVQAGVLFGSGFAVILFPWYFLVYKPYGHVLQGMAELNRPFLIPPDSPLKMLEHFWTRPAHVFNTLPVLSVLASVCFLLLVFRILLKPRGAPLLHWILVFWYISGFSYLSIIYQRVPRRLIPMIVPTVLLSVLLLRKFLQSDALRTPARIPPLFGPALLVWLFFPVSRLLQEILPHLPPSLSRLEPATRILAASSAVFVLILLVSLKHKRDRVVMKFSRSFKTVTVVLISLLTLLISGTKYTAWALHPQFKLKTLSRDLGRALDKAVLAGLWAPVLSLENTFRAHEYFPGVFNDSPDFLSKYRITHVVATDFFGNQEDNFYKRDFPEDMAEAVLLARFPIWRGHVLLYDLHPLPSRTSPDPGSEAEIFTLDPGFPRYDPEASNAFAVDVRPGHAGLVAEIPLAEDLTRGVHRFLLRVKKSGDARTPNARIGRLDAVARDQDRVLGIKNLVAEDFPRDGMYFDIPLDVRILKPQAISLRIYSDGAVNLWVDSIRPSEPPSPVDVDHDP